MIPAGSIDLSVSMNAWGAGHCNPSQIRLQAKDPRRSRNPRVVGLEAVAGRRPLVNRSAIAAQSVWEGRSFIFV